MKFSILTIGSLLALFCDQSNAQVQTTGFFPNTASSGNFSPRKHYALPHMDNMRILAREMLAQEFGGAKPYKFGEAVRFPLDIKKDGEWTAHESGTARVWRAKITSEGATSLSVRFNDFYLPPHSELYGTIGALTGRLNNKEDGTFSTMPLAGEEVVLEYWEAIEDEQKDNAATTSARIQVESVVHGFRKSPFEPSISGSCNIDVACPDGNRWRDQINSVGVFMTDRGQRYCTGTILNNAKQDGRQLFLTANHCLFQPDTSNFIVGFNYQHRTCHSGGVPDSMPVSIQTVQGMKLLAKWEKSDFALFEILENIPDSYNVFYAGWNRDMTAPSDVVCIHHPSGDVKKISRYSGVMTPSSWGENPNQYHWLVPAWTTGVTEQGSSGSAIFDNLGRVRGHLHGGVSSCSNPKEFDMFGGLAFDWKTAPNNTLNTLHQHLDPEGKRVRAMGGSYYTSSKKNVPKSPADANGMVAMVPVESEIDQDLSVDKKPSLKAKQQLRAPNVALEMGALLVEEMAAALYDEVKA